MGTGSNIVRSVVPTHQGATVRILVVVRPEAVTNLVSQSHDGVVFTRLDVVVDEGHEGRVESTSHQISKHLKTCWWMQRKKGYSEQLVVHLHYVKYVKSQNVRTPTYR